MEKITENDLLDNKENTRKDWDPDTLMKKVPKQIEEGVKFAELADVIRKRKSSHMIYIDT